MSKFYSNNHMYQSNNHRDIASAKDAALYARSIYIGQHGPNSKHPYQYYAGVVAVRRRNNPMTHTTMNRHYGGMPVTRLHTFGKHMSNVQMINLSVSERGINDYNSGNRKIANLLQSSRNPRIKQVASLMGDPNFIKSKARSKQPIAKNVGFNAQVDKLGYTHQFNPNTITPPHVPYTHISAPFSAKVEDALNKRSKDTPRRNYSRSYNNGYHRSYNRGYNSSYNHNYSRYGYRRSYGHARMVPQNYRSNISRQNAENAKYSRLSRAFSNYNNRKHYNNNYSHARRMNAYRNNGLQP